MQKINLKGEKKGRGENKIEGEEEEEEEALPLGKRNNFW